MIPKVIHHIAPKDKTKWHKLWNPCRDSWLKQFSDFKFILWNDKEDIDSLVKNSYPQYWDFYSSLPYHIMKIDFARFCILHSYGGIYADMDMFCYKNFYDELKEDLYFLHAPWGNFFLENALMCSSPNNKFWVDCMDSSTKQKITNREFKRLITSFCGPELVANVFRKSKLSEKNILIGDKYNCHGLAYDESFITKHVLTGVWGEDVSVRTAEQNYIKDKSPYGNLEIKDISEFDFYKDYTDGKYDKHHKIDFDRNNLIGPVISTKIEYL